MPKGIYVHSKRTTKEDIKQFVIFCMRNDIAEQLAKVRMPHKLAVRLYEDETGIKIKESTAYNQRDKWYSVNGNVYEKA